ncbi:MAG: hypothetical protein DRP08_08275 [Candidatus Aenigmatarchaeota archaeon]|nr:MAG: hypothetical protein DRP08_08275 [Candidatus Aenigmarchaeota archaeon]
MGDVGHQLASIQPALTAAQARAAGLTQQAIRGEERSLLPFEKEFTLLQQHQARQFSGYTFENQLELDRLLANQRTGAQLTDSERNRINQLAIAEKGYQNALDRIRLQGEQDRETYGYKNDLSNQYSSLETGFWDLWG